MFWFVKNRSDFSKPSVTAMASNRLALEANHNV